MFENLLSTYFLLGHMYAVTKIWFINRTFAFSMKHFVCYDGMVARPVGHIRLNFARMNVVTFDWARRPQNWK